MFQQSLVTPRLRIPPYLIKDWLSDSDLDYFGFLLIVILCDVTLLL